MKRKLIKQGRSIWSEEENKYLLGLIQEQPTLSWNEIANYLTEKFGRKKSGKQCRERYRNYLNPSLEKSDWRPQEKLLFMILHQLYGNQWCNISKYLNSRSDIVIKNYFYCQVRKAIKYLTSRKTPQSLLKKLEKFYLMYSILKRIYENYLPEVKTKHVLPKYGNKERIILNLLIERNIKEEATKSYMQRMIDAFKLFYRSMNLPVTISLSLKQFNISTAQAKELISKQHLFNSAPLNQLIVVEVSNIGTNTSTLPMIPTDDLHTLQLENLSKQANYLHYWSQGVCYPINGYSKSLMLFSLPYAQTIFKHPSIYSTLGSVNINSDLLRSEENALYVNLPIKLFYPVDNMTIEGLKQLGKK